MNQQSKSYIADAVRKYRFWRHNNQNNCSLSVWRKVADISSNLCYLESFEWKSPSQLLYMNLTIISTVIWGMGSYFFFSFLDAWSQPWALILVIGEASDILTSGLQFLWFYSVHFFSVVQGFGTISNIIYSNTFLGYANLCNTRKALAISDTDIADWQISPKSIVDSWDAGRW